MIRETIRRDLTRDVAELCAVIFIADVVSGILSPTFSLFAEKLGVSLALLGIITTVGGLTRWPSPFPLGWSRTVSAARACCSAASVACPSVL